MLTLKPSCLPWAAQGHLRSPFPSHTPRKGQLGSRGVDRWGEIRTQDPVSTPPRTMEAKSLPLLRRLLAPARPGLESPAKYLAFSSDRRPHFLEPWLPRAAGAPGPDVHSCCRPTAAPCDYIHAHREMVSFIPLTDPEIL